MKKINKILATIFGLIYICLIIFFFKKCLETGDKSSNSSLYVARFVQSILNNLFGQHIELDDQFLHIIRKLIGHFGFNLVLGITSIIFYINLCIKKLYTILLHYGVGFLIAFISEFLLEGITSGRSASFNDVLIDYAGFLSISTIIVLTYYMKKMPVNEG